MATDPRNSGSSDRVPTGIPALDTILNGGLVPGRPYLVVGPSGTGKTTFALQFLIEGVRRGEKTLIVTLEEPPNEMRINHRNLPKDLEKVYVFDAIPDVMRYERTPFKDIAAVRESVPFGRVPPEIRKTPELTSVEVTFTALEQTIKSEMVRQNYRRLVIDSLTALQYFCMKGIDETLGAQTFLRFLSDLKATTLLTVESPVEDLELPEQLLARGEVRLFRWEHEGRTVRAIGVEKFRGSTHDIRLHPYRIGSNGIDIDLSVTISRDTREIIGPAVQGEPAVEWSLQPETEVSLARVFGPMEQDLRDLVTVGVDVGAIRRTIARALETAKAGHTQEAEEFASRARARIHEMIQQYAQAIADAGAEGVQKMETSSRRLLSRATDLRAGLPPAFVPEYGAASEPLADLELSPRPTRSAPTAVRSLEPAEAASPKPVRGEREDAVRPFVQAAAPPEPTAATATPALAKRASSPTTPPLPRAGSSPIRPSESVGGPPAPAGPAVPGDARSPPSLEASSGRANRPRLPQPVAPPVAEARAPMPSTLPAPSGAASPTPPSPEPSTQAPAPAAPAAISATSSPLAEQPTLGPGTLIEASAPARRRRRSTGARKKLGGSHLPIAAPSDPSGPVSATSSDHLVVPPVVPAKPRRKPVRKRKAPTVTSAQPGVPPPPEHTPQVAETGSESTQRAASPGSQPAETGSG